MKRLFYDIETSPNLGLFWRPGYNVRITHEQIVKERGVITVAWKWHGEKTVHALEWDKNQNDRSLLENFIPILNEADESVAHYGDSFDLPWLKGRALFHDIPTFPKYRTVDTKAWASKYFDLNSAKLDYIAQYLGLGSKLKTEYDLWKKIVLNKDPKALKYMVQYNKWDVELLEQVYDRMALHVPHRTHVGVLSGGEKWHCARCASKGVKLSKTRVTAAGSKQYQMQCGSCGAYYSISESSYRDYSKKRK